MKSRFAACTRRMAVSLVLLLAGLGAHAATLQVFIDSDNSTATGCTLPIPGGTFAGAEEVLTTDIDTTTSPPTVGAVVQQTCVAPPAGLGAPVPVSPGGWSVGVGMGVGGYDVIETFFPVAAPVGTYRFGFLYTDPITGTDALVTVNGAPGGGPIVFAVGPGSAIPVLTDAGIFLLALLLWIVAARALKRRQVPTALVSALFVVVMAGATIAAVTLDGQIADWAGLSPIASDPVGDAAGGSDIAAAFAKAERAEGRIYLRADVKTASPPAAAADAYAGTAGVPLAIAAPGVLGNDSLGIPAATVSSFGGGNAGGAVTTNAAGASAAFGVGGSLSVGANGSIAFTPAAGFTGPFSFSYRATNAYGTSDGAVTITVNQAAAITSANAVTFFALVPNTFTVTATGFPVPSLSLGACAPALPAGVGFVDNGNGTGTLSGSPPTGSSGAYGCTITASSTAGNATQGFTLTVNEGPVAANDAYSLVHDTILAVPAGTGLLSNDSGVPAPTVTSITALATCAPPCTSATTNGSVTVAADGSFSYTPAALFAGTDTFSYTATNAGGSSSATVTLTVTSAPPVADLNGPAAGIDFGPVAFAEGGVPVAIVDSAQLTVADADSANLASATVVITNILDGAAESLAVTCPGIAPACSGAILVADVTFPVAGTLAITRSAPLADYQALLRTLTYENTSNAPTTTDRDITVTVNDAIGNNSPLAHATVTLAAENDAPGVTAPATALTPVNTPFNFAATASVSDPDSGASPVKVTITTTNGTAALSGTAGLAVTGNGTASIVSTGPIAAQVTALNGLVYTPTTAYAGAASLKIDIDDQGNTGSGGPLTATSTVAITVDTPPSVTGTTPANGATSVGLNATITVNFSEPVTVTGTAFKLECPAGSPRAFTVAPASPAASFVLTPTLPLPAGVPCTVTVVAAQVTDSAGQHPAADYPTGFTVDTLPTVTSTVPANAAPAVAPSTTVTVNFSEPVNASAASFTLECPAGSAKAFTLSASPSATFVLTPTLALPTGTACAATVVAANVTDVDASQPMAANFPFGFTTGTPPAITSAALANFSVGVAGTFTVTATGNPTPAITRTGTLPSGLGFLDNGDGTATLSGTPAAGTDAASPYAQVLSATNLAGSATQNFTLNVCPVIAATPAAIAQPTRTNAYSFSLGASGGTGPYTFAVTAGALPGGLGITGAGAISGTVTGAGAYGFTVTVTDTASGCTGTTAYSGTINEPPAAATDSYEAVGNTLLEVASPGAAATPKILVTSSNVLSNDNDGNGGANGTGVTATAGTFASANGGTVTLAANGTFTYLPPVGFTGADSFNYSVSDGVGTATGLVNVTVVAHRVWYVNNSGAAGDGRSSSPFNTLAAAATAATTANDTIYLFRGDGSNTGQNAGVTLEDGQRLVGEAVALDVPVTVNGVATPTLQAAGSTPVLSNAGGNGVTLGSGNTLKGFNVGTSSGAAIFGANVGTLAVGTVSVTTSGAGVDLTGVGLPSVNVVLGGLTSTGGAKNVNLVGLAGTVNLGSGALSGATGNAFDVSGGGNANITYSGTIANSATGARVVSVAGKTGGTVALSGAITSSGTNPAGVVLTGNTGATINFTGILNLATGTNPAFTATGGGTVSATASASTLAATTAAALNVANTTIGGGGLVFSSISSNGGTGNGITLDNTGALGGLTVNGDGTNTSVGGNGSGGTIANKGGADGNATQGIGIYLNNTRDVVLRRMNVSGTNQNYGIRGNQVNGFTLEYSTVTGTHGTAASLAFPENAGEGSIYFGNASTNGIATSGTFTKNAINGGRARNVSIINTTGTAALAFKGNTFGLNLNFSDANQSLLVEARNAGTTVTATVGGAAAGEPNSFAGSPGDLVNFTGQTGTTMTVTLNGNTLANTHAQNIIGGGGVTLATQGSMSFDMQNNTMSGADGSALTLQLASAGTLLSGKFINNTIGTSGLADSGSKTGNGIFGSFAGAGTATLNLAGNTILQYAGNAGMYFDNTGGSYTANFTIANNTVAQPGAGAFAGLALTNGAPSSADTINVCADIRNNDFSAGDPVNANDVIVGASGAAAGHTFNLPGYAGGANLANVQNFINTNNLNGGATAVTAYFDAPATAAAFTGAGVNCPTPP